ncbi:MULTISPECIES: peptide ABC transporter substrate-binding protein [Psychrobacillus]|uniref:Peptide ABC transporter substrate-binding protein n=1 Tax=Psychrobacillus lasiicapitis TaxID=1636719 RepID=A0A544TEB2_9BACI|nr:MULTISPECIES: peptide ABC transporter substrate-binding protein [Psychrobacillus]MDI2589669.1 peptide ABC transporter substrate-binding protein [Psychrobacillus sp. NEAU-3TGS]TQR15785.1 peptide ABC transporter substrate-binding protein [Psychrobacillus lasiicapitis]GGA18064.1 peptide ABC transporter substrate-binding protein [Psychrobacillus lasiicapitis]
MKNSKFAWLLSLMLVVALFLAACGGDKEEGTETTTDTTDKEKDATTEEVATDEEQVLNLIMTAEIPTMDSALVTDAVGFDLLNNVNEGLYRLNQDNVAEPAISEGEPTVSEDGLVYTFKLRDAKWSDGSPVTANDFEFAWKRAMNPDTASEYGPYMMDGVIKNATAIMEGSAEYTELGVKAVDEKTLEVTLEKPTPYFLSLMSFGTFLPQKEEFVTAQGENYAKNSEALLYNGPFTLANWDGTGLSWQLLKNEEYWDKDTVKLTEINYDVVKEPGTAVNLYTEGQKDRAGLTGEFAMQYAADPELINESETSVFYFKYNQERLGEKTPLANVNIREAMSKGFNKQDLVDVVLANGSVPANYLVPKDFTFDEDANDFRDVNGDMAEFNAEEAKAAFDKGLSELGVSELEIELLNGDTESAKKMGEYLKNQLETNLPGLTVKLKEVPFNVRLDLDTNQDYEMQIAGWGPDYQDPYTFMNLWLTGGGNNQMSYSNPEYDKLVTSSVNELAQDPEARWQALADAEKLLIDEDFGIGPIYQRGLMFLQKPYVKGIVAHPFGGDYSYKWAYIEGKN